MSDLIYIIKVRVPVFGCKLHKEYIDKLLFSNGVMPDETVDGENKQITYEFDDINKADRAAKELAKLLNLKTFRLDCSNRPRYKDDWEKYEHLLQTMDWYFEMSDDHWVWSSGHAQMSEINRLRGILGETDSKRAADLFKKHTPKRS